MNFKKNKALAVVGMCGTGKSVVTDFLVSKGWDRIYFGDVVLNKVREKGLPLTQENERPVREALRKEHGMEACAVVLYPNIAESMQTKNVILESLYSWSEYKYLKERLHDQLLVLAVISDSEKRYERLVTRDFRPLTRDQAVNRDISELEKLEKGGPIAIADYYIYNNGTEEDLKKEVSKLLELLDR